MTNLANVALVGFANNQEAAARLRAAQNSEWQQVARDRGDLAKVKQQLMDPYQPRIARTIADQQKDWESRGAFKPFTPKKSKNRDRKKRLRTEKPPWKKPRVDSAPWGGKKRPRPYERSGGKRERGGVYIPYEDKENADRAAKRRRADGSSTDRRGDGDPKDGQ